jgi:hypothetical protein
MSFWASVIGVVFAAAAALLWGWSALVNIPMIKSAYGALARDKEFYAALSRIGTLNAAAAGCAFVSACAQAVALWSK